MHKQQLKYVVTLGMIAAAALVGSLIYLFTENWRLAGTVGGLLLLTDLILVPKVMPHIFNNDDNN